MFFTRDSKSNDCFNSKCIFYETFHQEYLISGKGAMTRMINSTCHIFFFFFFFLQISKVNVITLLVPFLFAKRTNRMIHRVVSFFVSRVSDNETSRKVRNIDANPHRVITRSGFILWSRFAARAKFNQSS